MFCHTCGSLLVPEKNEYGKWLKCPNDHVQPQMVTSSETLIFKNTQAGKKMEIMDGDNVLAVHDFPCEKCGHGKAELIEIMPSYSDEDNTFRMKCGKCGFVKQLDGKVK
ncbi:MAG: hypothetical protein AABY26_02005, partial [Nanoarchaeota archaeon]